MMIATDIIQILLRWGIIRKIRVLLMWNINRYTMFFAQGGLAKEFTDACRAKKIAPFFYYEMLDRYPETYYNDFTAHLEYMRSEVGVRNMYTFQSERASEKLETYE